jgi:hypothetical protein
MIQSSKCSLLAAFHRRRRLCGRFENLGILLLLHLLFLRERQLRGEYQELGLAHSLMSIPPGCIAISFKGALKPLFEAPITILTSFAFATLLSASVSTFCDSLFANCSLHCLH